MTAYTIASEGMMESEGMMGSEGKMGRVTRTPRPPARPLPINLLSGRDFIVTPFGCHDDGGVLDGIDAGRR